MRKSLLFFTFATAVIPFFKKCAAQTLINNAVMKSTDT